MYIVKIRESKRKTTKALLSDGRTVKVPVGKLSWGSILKDEDIIDVDGVLHHRSLVKEKKEYDYYLQRDLTGYDPKVELENIKYFISVLFVEIMGRSWISADEYDEVVSYCAEAFTRRRVYEKYNPEHPGSYKGYTKTIVYNLLRDYRRKVYSHPELTMVSLNNLVKEDGNSELIDFVVATGTDVSEKFEYEYMLEKLSVCVTRLDEVGTGLPGFTYKDLFNTMVNGESLDDYLRSFKYPRKLLDEYVSDFRRHLVTVLDELGVAC